ncbi:hypothetical protein [Roseibium litorale]|uniref:Uncharacterized protein n=1 Tax=Roseibium litorale TaxID=2803841 RepID=A0ABR9CHT6_9HYPH|nr:hypothetical protein [Roseibium litorale]MBD8890293.1 hypothetical protein [Roseibium litorale]
MIPLELPKSSGMKPVHFTILTGGIAVLTVLYICVLAARWTGAWRGEMYWTPDPNGLHMRVGGVEMVVDGGLMRTPSQRLTQTLTQATGGRSLDRLELSALWPAMTGFAANDRRSSGAFRKGSNLIEVDVLADTGQETMRDQLEPVYRRLARGPEVSGPAGLEVLTLSSPVSLMLDQIVFEPGTQSDFIARCRTHKDKTAVCERELRSDGLIVRYRFEKGLLANWGRLDRKVLGLIKGLTV